MSGAVLYEELAEWWPLLSAPEDYAEEAGIFLDLIARGFDGTPVTLLELGSGGGNNALHMKAGFKEVTLVDRSDAMLSVSARLNPDCEHLRGDMRSLRIGRTFDVVFVHDAIVYAATPADLSAVMETAREHLRPGGMALFVPDFLKETFEPGTSSGGHDGEGRALRYLAWTFDPDPDDCTYLVDYAFLIREGDSTPRVLHERHEEGLFTEQEWLSLMAGAGLKPRAAPFMHTEVEHSMTAFVGIRED